MKQKAAPKPRVRIAALRQEIAELWTVGAQMANVCFNLQQRQTSDPHERQLMRNLHQEWDHIERAERGELERDRERLDWLEANLDEASVIRDISNGPRFEISYCSEEAGCPEDSVATSLRAAIDAARGVK